ncbi:MAG: hypothetical protein HGB14_04880 [Anaerolineaceae bacterium]|nr:hypothetical protein [Anaerolineaceae bacterium]
MDFPENTVSNNNETMKVDANQKDNKKIIFLVIGLIVVIALVVFAFVRLFQADLETTSRIRDIFIIFMALQSIVLGIAIIILIIQLATLINVFKNEIKPILETTNETLRNLRGTTSFLSNNLVEPVMKMNEYSAGFKKFFDILKPKKK